MSLVTYLTVFLFCWQSLLVDAEQKTCFAFASCSCCLVSRPSCKGCSAFPLSVLLLFAQRWLRDGLCQGPASASWCLPSRSSALIYTSLHGTSSSQFMPKSLDYNSLRLAMEVLLLVGDWEPCASNPRASRLLASAPQERSGQKSAQPSK